MPLGGVPGQRNLYLERSPGQVGPRKFRRAADRTESKAAKEHGNKAGLSTLARALYFVFAKSPSEEQVSCFILPL